MALNINDIILDGKTSDPTSPVDGEMWFRSDTNEWRFRKNGQTKKLASKKTSTSEEDVAQCKCDATTAPVSTNDSSEGYTVGSHWIDITANKAYICVDDTATSAIWIEVTQTGGGGSTSFTPEKTNISGDATATWVSRSLGAGYANKELQIIIEQTTNTSQDVGVREVGSSLSLFFRIGRGNSTRTVVADASGDIEIYAASLDATFWITGTKQ